MASAQGGVWATRAGAGLFLSPHPKHVEEGTAAGIV